METYSKVSKVRVNYVNNKSLYKVLKTYKEKRNEALLLDLPRPAIPKEFGDAILSIAQKYSNIKSYRDYTWKDEMISDAVTCCMMYVGTFDPAKGVNPFAYFTQVINNSFLNRIKKEKKQQYIVAKMAEKSGIVTKIDHAYSQRIVNYETMLMTNRLKYQMREQKKREAKKAV